jgi:hypothetical protein
MACGTAGTGVRWSIRVSSRLLDPVRVPGVPGVPKRWLTWEIFPPEWGQHRGQPGLRCPRPTETGDDSSADRLRATQNFSTGSRRVQGAPHAGRSAARPRSCLRPTRPAVHHTDAYDQTRTRRTRTTGSRSRSETVGTKRLGPSTRRPSLGPRHPRQPHAHQPRINMRNRCRGLTRAPWGRHLA